MKDYISSLLYMATSPSPLPRALSITSPFHHLAPYSARLQRRILPPDIAASAARRRARRRTRSGVMAVHKQAWLALRLVRDRDTEEAIWDAEVAFGRPSLLPGSFTNCKVLLGSALDSFTSADTLDIPINSDGIPFIVAHPAGRDALHHREEPRRQIRLAAP
ncbi:hypothetical protein BJ912DRAFT_1080757 [Pholiota molesta]|nr:hypothetical protein BJ912DRAFT_1080757 [Pholiota molesta]